MLTNLPTRFRAITELQTRRARHTPGSWQFEALDHAIDLVLESRRSINSYLLRNVIRDARRVNTRRRRKQREFLASELYTPSGEDSYLEIAFENRIPDYSSPDEELAALDIANKGLHAVGGDGRAERLMIGVVDGYSTRELARSLSISPAYAATLAKRARQAVALASARPFP